MRFTKLSLILALAALPFAALAQDITTVNVSARGTDVRPVIHDLFDQAKKNYVLEPGVTLSLYLSLHDMEFEEAFALICKNAGLTYELQNGIYFIKADPKGPAAQVVKTELVHKPNVVAPVLPKTTEIRTMLKSEPIKPRLSEDSLNIVPPLSGAKVAKPLATPAKAGTLDKKVLSKRITTRLQKVDLRDLVTALSGQTGLTIEVADDVPGYKMDAILLRTSLKYALDRITKAAGLNYIFTDRYSILIQNGPASKRS